MRIKIDSPFATPKDIARILRISPSRVKELSKLFNSSKSKLKADRSVGKVSRLRGGHVRGPLSISYSKSNSGHLKRKSKPRALRKRLARAKTSKASR
jgi:hypothetical protein